MNIEIGTEGAFGSALITLETGEKFVSEAGAMYRASDNINIDVTIMPCTTDDIHSDS